MTKVTTNKDTLRGVFPSSPRKELIQIIKQPNRECECIGSLNYEIKNVALSEKLVTEFTGNTNYADHVGVVIDAQSNKTVAAYTLKAGVVKQDRRPDKSFNTLLKQYPWMPFKEIER